MGSVTLSTKRQAPPPNSARPLLGFTVKAAQDLWSWLDRPISLPLGEPPSAHNLPEFFGEQDFRLLLKASLAGALAITASAVVGGGPITFLAGTINVIIFVFLLSFQRELPLYYGKLITIMAMWTTAVLVMSAAQGIRDGALLLFPIVLLYGSITFDRRVFWSVTGGSVLAVAIIGLAELWGYLKTDFPVNRLESDLTAALVLLIFTGLFIDVYLTNLRRSVSELARSKKAIEKADRTKREFLTIVTHELRSPLNPILGYAQMLEDEVQDSEHRAALANIRQAGKDLLEMIDNVLDYSRLADGTVALVPSEVSVCELCEEATALNLPSADAKKVRLNLDCAACAVPGLADYVVRLDRDRACQILRLLIASAIKYTKPGGFITLKIFEPQSTGGFCRFMICDSGIAVDEGEEEKVFEPFYHESDNVNHRERAGLGLGLATARQLARLMDGDLRCEKSPAKGSCFVLDLPTL